jgi:glutamate/aspartate transport system substrate-binding protein
MQRPGRILCAAACLLLSAAARCADERKSPTLEKIHGYAAIYVGYSETAAPFSYLDAGGKAIGYSLELCHYVVDAVKARTGLTALAVVPVPVAAGLAQVMVESGTVDLYCAAASNSQQRQRAVAFSVTTFAAGMAVLVRKDSGLRALADLQGALVVSVAGTNAENAVKVAAARRSLTLSYRLARDEDAALRQVLDGRARVMVLDEVRLHALLMNAPDVDAGQLVILADDIAVEPYAIMFRRNDGEFKTLVDNTLTGLMKSGEFDRVYARWFTQPIPPKNKSLVLPMNDLLRQLILTPNDKGS